MYPAWEHLSSGPCVLLEQFGNFSRNNFFARAQRLWRLVIQCVDSTYRTIKNKFGDTRPTPSEERGTDNSYGKSNVTSQILVTIFFLPSLEKFQWGFMATGLNKNSDIYRQQSCGTKTAGRPSLVLIIWKVNNLQHAFHPELVNYSTK